MNSDENRIARRILKEQINSGKENNWWGEVKKVLKDFQMDEIEVEEISKTKWKATTIRRMKNLLNERVKSSEKTKVRFLKDWNEKDYVTKLTKADSKLIMDARLNMIEIGENFKGKKTITNKCPVYDDVLTTEHLANYDDGCTNVVADIGDENIENLKNICLKIKTFLQNYEHIIYK
eukprot:TCONS_00042529-protein